MPVGHHVRLRARDDRVVTPSPADRRRYARTVLEVGREFGLLCFRGADTHGHVELACNRDAAGEFARRVEIALTLGLGVDGGFQPAWVGPIHDQRHLQATFRYILRQRDHHELESDPFHEASNLPDLLGLRPLGVYTAARVRELLPRVHRDDLLELLGADLGSPPDPRHLAEVHAATFELAPSCVPYAGEHLFGEGSQRRGPLLVGLAEACQRAGVAHEGELPDHVSVLLRLLPRLPDEEATELASLCLSPLLDGMAAALEQTDNPYRHLVAATRAWLSAEVLRA